MIIRTILIALTFLMISGCSKSYDLTGEWNARDWGSVVFVDFQGSYSSTFGAEPGRIDLKRQEDGSYTGTWAEGRKRFGTLAIKFKDKNTLIGNWSADPNSEIKASDGGVILWQRKI